MAARRGSGVRGDEGSLFPDPSEEPAARAPRPAERSAPEVPPEPTGPEVISVGELTRRVRARVESLGRLSVEGEVSQLRTPASGHLYFILKDADAVLSCSIWKSRIGRALPFALKEGMRVVTRGALDVYAPRGSYSLLVERVEQRGLGALLVELERLKAELRERGWFERRRPLPHLPRPIGVVASRDSAAFQDFLRTRSKRWPGYPVRLAHSAVQGAGAAAQIADAIRRLDASGVDVIAVIRGGGSLEDLWAFNERAVAEAVWEASVPVVTGVGHETDVTLIDLVADARAHTPTDAAQGVIPDRDALVAELERRVGYLTQAGDELLVRRTERLERAARSRVLRDADWLLAEGRADLARAARALAGAGRRLVGAAEGRLTRALAILERARPALFVEQARRRADTAGERLGRALLERLSGLERRLAAADASLRATSPLAVLERGYSITRRVGQTRPLVEGEGLAAGSAIETVLARGRIVSRVESSSSEPAEASGSQGSEAD